MEEVQPRDGSRGKDVTTTQNDPFCLASIAMALHSQ